MKRTDYHREYYRANAEKLRPRAAEAKRRTRMATDGRRKPPAWYTEVMDKLKAQEAAKRA